MEEGKKKKNSVLRLSALPSGVSLEAAERARGRTHERVEHDGAILL